MPTVPTQPESRSVTHPNASRQDGMGCAVSRESPFASTQTRPAVSVAPSAPTQATATAPAPATNASSR